MIYIHYSQDENNTNRMRELVDLWWNSDSIIGQILKFVYDSGSGVSELELKDYITFSGSNNVNELYNELNRKKRGHSLIFERSKNGITNINEIAREYIATL